MELTLGYPCHKYIMRNMDCSNERQVAEFAKSYYLLKKGDETDSSILAQLFALGEYSKLPGKHEGPDYLHRGDITYKEESYLSSLEKDGSVSVYSCEEFAQRHLKKLHICQVCPRCYHNVMSMTGQYEKLLRSIITDADLHLQFEIACKKANVDVNNFFVIPYDLGDIFTTRSPHIVPVMQMIYDYYYENASSLFMMLAMDIGAPREICKVALKGISKKCVLSPMITDIPAYKDIIVDSYYEKIFLSDDKFTTQQIEEILPELLLFSKEYIRIKHEQEEKVEKVKSEKKSISRKKKKEPVVKTEDKKIEVPKPVSKQIDKVDSEEILSDTKEDVSSPVRVSISEETAIVYQEICLDFLADDLPDDESLLEEGVATAAVAAQEISSEYESEIIAVSDDIPDETHEPLQLPVQNDVELPSVTMNEKEDICKSVTTLISTKNEVCYTPVFDKLYDLEEYSATKQYRFRKGNPVFCEVVFMEHDKKEYMIFGNLASRHSGLYYISEDDSPEVVHSLFADPEYHFVTYNGYSFIRFLKERDVIPRQYTCLCDIYFYMTHRHSCYKDELMELSSQAFVGDILNILSMYKESYYRHVVYLKKWNRQMEYSFFSERQHTLNLSHASYIQFMDTYRKNKNYLLCETVSRRELYFTKYIPKPLSQSGQYCLFSVTGFSSDKKMLDFEDKILSVLYYKKYMISYKLILLYVGNAEFIFYCSLHDSPKFISHMEAEMLEIGRQLSQNILLEQKVVVL